MRRPPFSLCSMRAALAAALATLTLSSAGPARAELWCADPLYVHEWGVHVVSGNGGPTAALAVPGWFHSPWDPKPPEGPVPVRQLPADSGIRALPVLHFYGETHYGPTIPIGIEVGFRDGPALSWFPAVDLLRDAQLANGPVAQAARAKLVADRLARQNRFQAGPTLPSDPTRQLVWDRLDLVAAPPTSPRGTDVAWVQAARNLDRALWVTAPRETERFVYYEAKTSEKAPLVLRRGDTFGPGRRHYIIDNKGSFPVHDVMVIHREGTRVFVFEAPMIPPGAYAGFLLEDHLAKDPAAATVQRMKVLLTDRDQPAPPTDVRWGPNDCVMSRDPAIPVEEASGHRLYAAEVDLILGAWKARFFEQPGTTIVYREDAAALSAAMPLSIYTDMYHDVRLRRLGLALLSNVTLP